MIRMLWILVMAGTVMGQPTGCKDNSQCTVGYYCEPPGFCRECLRCSDLKRETLATHVGCVTSVSECGLCYPGLVDDPSGNVDAECVPAGSAPPPHHTSTAANEGPPSYLWITLSVGLLLLILIVVIVFYVLRNTDTLKILASTRTSLQSPCTPERRTDAEAVPPPPYTAPYTAPFTAPYNPEYEPVRPTSPPLDPVQDANGSVAKEEASAPFIKRAHSRRLRAQRERDSSQEARMFNNPHYVRGPQLPPSYDATLSGDESGPETQDEATVESPWTPEDDNRGLAITEVTEPSTTRVPELSTLLSEARGTTLLRPPERGDATPSKVLCVRQDSNNNNNRRGRDGEGPSSSGGPPPPAAPAGPPGPTGLTLNITVQQHNDLKLIRT